MPAVLQVLAAACVASVLAMTLLPIEWSRELSRWRAGTGRPTLRDLARPDHAERIPS